MRSLIVYIILALSLPLQVKAQQTMTLKEYYEIVGIYHPIALQAELLRDRGRLTVQQARGLFDPKLVAQYNRKRLNQKDYYNLWDSYLQVPTLLNVDFKAGYESADGQFINPENTTPTNGLYYAGVSIPIGQGLINNPRNTAFRQSRYLEQGYQNQSIIVMNSLLLDATYTYWNWYENDQKRRVVQNSLDLATDRFNWVRELVLTGESAAIDSVEALIQAQNWQNVLLGIDVALRNSYLTINNFIWTDSLVNTDYIPQSTIEFADFDMDKVLAQVPFTHPEVRKLLIKAEILDLDRRLAAEQIKPLLDFNYNFLLTTQENQLMTPFSNNYKVGVDFTFPIFVRKERAKLQLTKLKQLENELGTSDKIRSTSNKVLQAYNKVTTLRDMIAQQEIVLSNYVRLFQAEQIKFNNGEGSVFLLNSRESKKLESEIKLIELKSKYGQAIGELKFSSGILYDEVITIN